MAYKKEHTTDNIIRQRIKAYIVENKLSMTKTAEAMGMSYQKFYHFLYDKRMIKLHEYITLCEILNEPFELFIR